MIISLIAALDENRLIGDKNKIPWHIRDDLIHFKNLTLNHTVIMGRTTFDSLLEYYKKSGRPMPERRSVIVSRDTSYTVDQLNCFVVHSVDEALKVAVEMEMEAVGQGGEVFVSGGASIFAQTINKANKLPRLLIFYESGGGGEEESARRA